MSLETDGCAQQKEYDYLLKFLLVGDSDVGKHEMLNDLEDGSSESPYCSGSGKSQYLTIFALVDNIKFLFYY